MRVRTDFEVKHFITFTRVNAAPVKMSIIDFNNNYYITKVNGDSFEIHKDVLTCLKSNCPAMKVENLMLQ